MAVLFSPEQLDEVMGLALSDEQRAAACAPGQPAVIVAGAGTGKTTVMAARVVWLVGAGFVGPGEVLGLTFTRRACGELAERVQAGLTRAGLLDLDDLGAGEPVVSTYDAFAGEIVRTEGLRLGIEPGRRLLGRAQRFQLACEAVRGSAWPFSELARLTVGSVAARALSLDAELSGHLVEVAAARAATSAFLEDGERAPGWARGRYKAIDEALGVARARLELLDVVEDYRARKQAAGVWEFADQMAAAVGLAESVPAVGARLRDRYKVVLLDEYQDTSVAQIRLLRAAFSGPDVAHGLGHPVTAVGDPLQSIYGWRGAAADTVEGFPAAFPTAAHAPAGCFTLSVNRRSGQHILDAANALARLARGDASPETVRLVAPPGHAPGDLRGASFATAGEEVSWVAQAVVDAHRCGTAPRWSDIAILTRRRADLAPFAEALTALDVPVNVVGLGGLLATPEVGQITATLRLLVDVTHNPSVVALLGGPRWRLGPGDLARLGARAADLCGDHGEPCLLDAVADPGPGFRAGTARRLRAFGDELNRLATHADDPPDRLVALVADTIGLRAEIAARPDRWGRAAAHQIDQFARAAAEFGATAGPDGLASLVAWLDAQEEVGEELDQAAPDLDDSVKLLTVHAAKGLEWEVVFAPCLTQGVFPGDEVDADWTLHARTMPAALRGDAASVPQLTAVTRDGLRAYHADLATWVGHAEERLAYVAASRARQLLVGTTSAWRTGTKKPRSPSRVFTALADVLAGQDRPVPIAEVGDTNPVADAPTWPWPFPDPDAELLTEAAVWARAAADADSGPGGGLAASWLPPGLGEAGRPAVPDELSAEDARRAVRWIEDARRLCRAEVQERRGLTIRLPRSLSVSQVLRAVHDQSDLASSLIRPMPRPVVPHASLGSRFHGWLQERFALPPTLDDTIAGPDDADLEAGPADAVPDDAAFESLVAAFLAGPYADRVPLAVESSYVLTLGGHEVRGRIDAVYAGDGTPYRFQVVDWKTQRAPVADPLQLSFYRLAWARAHGCRPDEVDAVFCYVRTGRIVRPSGLLDEAGLVGLLTSLQP
ncbi:MAG: ATP-dependent helicase [Actinomycetia bacterium]|nr:ATP-dependent helicase [Actinomycetes bacterium]